jgi:hypothetical protein
MNAELKILKGGRLLRTSWEGKIEGFVQKDVTAEAIGNLFELCDLEEGVTLRDIFSVINTELTIFDAVLRNWTKEIVTEGLTGIPTNKLKEQHEEIEYLELYWGSYKGLDENKQPILYGHHRPELHGIGPVLLKDKLFEWGEVERKAGERITWGVSMTPTTDLIDLPVKLNKEFIIHDDENWRNPPTSMGKSEFTLGQILEAIVWELSFFGGPVDRDKKAVELNSMVTDIKECTSAEELFKELELNSSSNEPNSGS